MASGTEGGAAATELVGYSADRWALLQDGQEALQGEVLITQAPTRTAAVRTRRWAPLAAVGCALLGAVAWLQGPAHGALRRQASRADIVTLAAEVEEEEEENAETAGDFVVHEGLNCVNGQGAEAFGDENGAEGEIDGKTDFTLEECKEECRKRMPTCEGFIVVTDYSSNRCWLRTNIDKVGCYQGTPYNLWVWDESASPAEETDTPTEAPTEAATTAPTEAPTKLPTEAPTKAPSKSTTNAPTESPTEAPTAAPPKAHKKAHTKEPTEAPTQQPTKLPTDTPTSAPTAAATQESVFDVETSTGLEASTALETGTGLWPMEVKNMFCKNRDMFDTAKDQADCQSMCGDDCVGVAYSSKDDLSQYCYTCANDELIPSANDFHFHRKVIDAERSNDAEDQTTTEQAAEEDEQTKIDEGEKDEASIELLSMVHAEQTNTGSARDLNANDTNIAGSKTEDAGGSEEKHERAASHANTSEAKSAAEANASSSRKAATREHSEVAVFNATHNATEGNASSNNHLAAKVKATSGKNATEAHNKKVEATTGKKNATEAHSKKDATSNATLNATEGNASHNKHVAAKVKATRGKNNATQAHSKKDVVSDMHNASHGNASKHAKKTADGKADVASSPTGLKKVVRSGASPKTAGGVRHPKSATRVSVEDEKAKAKEDEKEKKLQEEEEDKKANAKKELLRRKEKEEEREKSLQEEEEVTVEDNKLKAKQEQQRLLEKKAEKEKRLREEEEERKRKEEAAEEKRLEKLIPSDEVAIR